MPQRPMITQLLYEFFLFPLFLSQRRPGAIHYSISNLLISYTNDPPLRYSPLSYHRLIPPTYLDSFHNILSCILETCSWVSSLPLTPGVMLLAHGVKGAVVLSCLFFSLFRPFPCRLSFSVLGRKCQ